MPERDTPDLDSTVPGHYGIAATGVTLSVATMAAAWNVQGDPTRTAFVAGVAQFFGVPLPLVPNTTKRGSGVIAFGKPRIFVEHARRLDSQNERLWNGRQLMADCVEKLENRRVPKISQT